MFAACKVIAVNPRVVVALETLEEKGLGRYPRGHSVGVGAFGSGVRLSRWVMLLFAGGAVAALLFYTAQAP